MAFDPENLKHGGFRVRDIREMGIGAYVAQLEAELRAARQEIALLNSELAMIELRGPRSFDPRDPHHYPFADRLTATELRVIGGLLACYPRHADPYDLAAVMCGDHARDPTLSNLRVHLTKLRAKLAKDAIETVRGSGYRLSAAFYDREIKPHRPSEPGPA